MNKLVCLGDIKHKLIVSLDVDHVLQDTKQWYTEKKIYTYIYLTKEFLFLLFSLVLINFEYKG
jgi:hypothetical protein